MIRDRVARGAIVARLVAGCGNSETTTTVRPTTTATTSPPATTLVPETTTTTEAGPIPLPAGGFLEPGEYYTTVFQPTVLYRIDRKFILDAFQQPIVIGFQNKRAAPGGGSGRGDLKYKGVVIHNRWLGLTLEDVETQLRKLEMITLGDTTAVVVAGYPGTQIEAFVAATERLWQEPGILPGEGTTSAWWLEPNQMMSFIILDTPAGSLLITIGADAEEWDDFLPVAEEILAGISFPDLD